MSRYNGYLTTILTVSLALLVISSSGAMAAQAVLAWNASGDSSVIGYKLYYGTQSGVYQTSIDVGNNTSYTLSGLSASQPYYFAVTAYSSNSQSPYSQQLTCDFITSQSGANGQITPSGVTSVTGGGSQTYSIVPNAGYQIGTVLVDGKQVNPASTYTFSNVNACHTISVTFTPLNNTTSTTAAAGTNQTFTISATYQGGGSISPAGAVSVPSGNNAQFTITPYTGYQISMVVVDGQSIGAVSSYSFPSVTANHSIEAFFTAVQSSNTASIQGNGTGSTSAKVSSGYARCCPAIQLLLLDPQQQ